MHARVISSRSLVYTDVASPDDDRPPHVRAASAIAARGDELFVIQDDAAFIARVRGDEVTSIMLPRERGRRRFEVALGNKLDKLDLESCVILDDELVAFGSGSLPIREHVVHMTFDGNVRVEHAPGLYAMLRDAIGGVINIEGVAVVGDELWFCHRGNTCKGDGPAIARVDFGLSAGAKRRTMSRVIAVDRYDLGRVDDIAIGFTDACGLASIGSADARSDADASRRSIDGVVFVAAAEASANAIDDGRVLASILGVIDRDGVRSTELTLDGKPEGIALTSPDRAWITVDLDDPAIPTRLYEVELNLR